MHTVSWYHLLFPQNAYRIGEQVVFAMQISVKFLGCFFRNPINAANVVYWNVLFWFGATEYPRLLEVM